MPCFLVSHLENFIKDLLDFLRNYICLLKLLFLAVFPLFAEDSSAILVNQIHAHILLQDSQMACEKGRFAIHQYPPHELLWEAYIKALARAGEEKEMLQAWKRYITLFPDKKTHRDLIEAMSWGVIEKGERSSSPLIRSVSLIAAFLAQDAKGVNIIYRNLKDRNSFMRGIALQLASNMRDDKLCDEVFHLFLEEPVWQIKLEAIKAVGKMKITKAKPYLTAIIANEKSLVEEKAAAIESLIHLFETANREDLIPLIRSDRAGLRLLACKIVAFLELHQQSDLLIPLIDDHRPEVRAAALKTLGTLRVDNEAVMERVEQHLNDHDSEVALTATWFLTLKDSLRGQQIFRKYFSHESKDVRHLAAGALSSCGKYAFPLIQEMFQKNHDPYVRMNLALGLIGQRISCDQACAVIDQGLTELNERWMIDEEAVFSVLVPSKIKHNDMIANYPEAINQKTRLEMLNVLSIMKHPRTQNALKKFLKEKNWGISGMASIMLLTEGDESAAELVTSLLTDSDSKVRIQAALILSLWGNGEEAISVLENSYEKADRELKEKILEGIGHIGSFSSLPFLLEKLNENHQTLRMIASSAILQILYH